MYETWRVSGSEKGATGPGSSQVSGCGESRAFLRWVCPTGVGGQRGGERKIKGEGVWTRPLALSLPLHRAEQTPGTPLHCPSR